MQNMNAYYDFSGQKFGHPLSLSINGFDRQVFSQQTSLELSYVLEGRYEVITEGFSRMLDRHQLALIAPGEIHMIRKAPGAENSAASVILTLHIDFERMPEALVGDVEGLFSTLVCTEEENAALLGRVRQTLGRLLRLLTQPEHSLFQLNALMMELADLCASGAHRPMDSIPLQSPLHESSRRAIRFINRNFRRDIHLEDVAKELSFSVSYTSKLFTKHIGLPFVKYLSYVRVRASLEALLEGKESIEAIALDCGMASAKAYAAAFKEMYGILPSVYRKRFLQNLRYSETGADQKMRLDAAHLALLDHLLRQPDQMIYQTPGLSILRRGEAVVCESEGPAALTQQQGKLVVEFGPKQD